MYDDDLREGFMKSARTTADLSPSVCQRLNMYALAASAAGVSFLANVQPVAAKVVYTPANIPISHPSNVSLDLNNDGIRDFVFSFAEYHGTFLHIKTTKLRPKNAVWGSNLNASALSSGVSVGPSTKFQAGRLLMASLNCSGGICGSYGSWKNAQNKYLGLAFLVNGEVHYGWARLNVNANKLSETVVTGYAYETVPNKPIVTGQTGDSDTTTEILTPEVSDVPGAQGASLGLLARGFSGLTAWRRKEY
jgi:hypothetical protein